MGTKSNPGQFDCYAKLADDEPYFVLRAKDPHAPILVELWAALREEMFGSSVKFREAWNCAEEMRRWASAHNVGPLRERKP